MRLWGLALAPLLCASSVLAAGPPLPLSPAALAAIAPVHDAYARLDAAYAAAPPPGDDRARLERLGELDQAGRKALREINFRALGPEAATARNAAWVEIKTRDRDNQVQLKAMMPATGWFESSRYGQTATWSAFHVVQHAVNDPGLMRDVLARMEPSVRRGEADGLAWAEMYDRVALEFDKKPQRYGTQVWCPYGAPAWSLRPLEDPDGVDARRKAVGIDQTQAEYMAEFAGKACPV
jgi:hypothetical protein